MKRDMEPPVVVACAADSAYALPLAVMLQSLVAHAEPEREIDVHIIDCGISAPMRNRIDGQVRPGLQIHWRPSIRPPNSRVQSWGHVSAATYERLQINQYLPDDTAHVLWLDCDLLVLDDITTLFRRPAGGHVLEAVRDPFVRTMKSAFGVRHWRELGLDGLTPYFNAGVMLIDMQRWRAAEVAERALHHLRQYGNQVFFRDQEALNAVIGAHWAPLEDRWNYSANPFHARAQSLGSDAPAVIHFTGRTKPWKLPDLGVAQDLFFQYLDHTSWRGTRPARTVKNRLLSWYVGSRVRRLSYPLENQHLRLCHYLGI